MIGLSHIYVALSHIGRYKPSIFTDPFGMVGMLEMQAPQSGMSGEVLR